MVKQIQIILDDNEYDELLKFKGERTWKTFLIEASKKESET
ncbi:hypothetical protein ES703_02609 [subsurface metagenome]